MFSGLKQMFCSAANQSVYLLAITKCKLLFIDEENGQIEWIELKNNLEDTDLTRPFSSRKMWNWWTCLNKLSLCMFHLLTVLQSYLHYRCGDCRPEGKIIVAK